ncbi:MAG: hypothetical protein VXZ38_05500 [Planctomycetota bacterium]|nr:hypothetical protein [Planctomycetota bacterium]
MSRRHESLRRVHDDHPAALTLRDARGDNNSCPQEKKQSQGDHSGPLGKRIGSNRHASIRQFAQKGQLRRKDE